MVEIILTDSGISLDLDPTGEFCVEIENALLDDNHIPVAYSTDITILPTQKNCKALGYVSAMWLAPTIRKIGATISVGGVPLFFGSLIYDSIEDGKLKYTFSGVNPEDEWSAYIHTLGHLSNPRWVYDNEALLGSWLEAVNYMSSVHNGIASEDFELPMLIGEANITDIEYPNDLTDEVTDFAIKYHNHKFYPAFTPSTPAVKVAAILRKAFTKVNVSSTLMHRYNSLAILGLHKQSLTSASYNFSIAANGDLLFDISDSLPNITIYELISGVAKMLCGTIYRDGEGYRFVANADIMTDSAALDWSQKVSRKISISSESPKDYIFNFANDPNENTYTNDSDSSEEGEGSIRDKATPLAVLDEIAANSSYVAVRYKDTADIYSGRRVKIFTNTPMPYLDMILHKLNSYSPDEKSSDTYDGSVPFKLVRCMPLRFWDPLATSPSTRRYAMCPIIPFPVAGSDRTSDVYIGCLLEGQMVDKGCAFSRPQLDATNENSEEIKDVTLSLEPGVLYEDLHQSFSQWLKSDRRVVSCDVFLSLVDIASFRFWQKVNIYNQSFLVKRASFTFKISSDNITTTCDFIDAPQSPSSTGRYINVINIESRMNSNRTDTRASDENEPNKLPTVGTIEELESIIIDTEIRAVAVAPVESSVVIEVTVNRCKPNGSTFIRGLTNLVIQKGETASQWQSQMWPIQIESISPESDTAQLYEIGDIHIV